MILWLLIILLFLVVPYAIAIPVIASLLPKRSSRLRIAMGGLIGGIGLTLIGMIAPSWIIDARINVHGGDPVLYILFIPLAFGFLGIIVGALAGSRC